MTFQEKFGRFMLGAAVVALVVLVSCQNAKSDDECVNPDQWHANIQEGNEGRILTPLMVVTKDELGAMWAIYSDPTRSTMVTAEDGVAGRASTGVDEGWLIMGKWPNGEPINTSIVGFFLKGCYVGSLVVPTAPPSEGDPA